MDVGPPEDGRVSPRKTTGGSFLNGSLGEGEAKERIKNAFKHVQSRHFSKASDLFRKKKKAKARQHHHSIHLAVPDDAGETTTDFEEPDSDASTDNRLDEGTNEKKHLPLEAKPGILSGSEYFRTFHFLSTIST